MPNVSRKFLLPFLLIGLLGLFLARQSSAQGSQAFWFLKRAFANLTGGTRVKDATLNGTATLYSGSSSQSGSVTLTSNGDTISEFDVVLPSGEFTDIRTTSSGTSNESGTGPSGVFYTFGAQGLGSVPVWFYPADAIAPGLDVSGNYNTTYVGRETRQGATVEHITVAQATNGQALPLTSHDIYLASPTLLPTEIDFSLPDSNGNLTIPIQVLYSNYQQVQGRQVAYHIQVYSQGALLWDIQLSSDAINTGVVIGGS